jgi:hypothetical protein
MNSQFIVPCSRRVSPHLLTPLTRYQRRFSTLKNSSLPSFRNLVARLGYITNNGLPTAQAPLAAKILTSISTDWRELIAGSEGFLTTEGKRGLYRRNVEWGEMVCAETHNLLY